MRFKYEFEVLHVGRRRCRCRCRHQLRRTTMIGIGSGTQAFYICGTKLNRTMEAHKIKWNETRDWTAGCWALTVLELKAFKWNSHHRRQRPSHHHVLILVYFNLIFAAFFFGLNVILCCDTVSPSGDVCVWKKIVIVISAFHFYSLHVNRERYETRFAIPFHVSWTMRPHISGAFAWRGLVIPGTRLPADSFRTTSKTNGCKSSEKMNSSSERLQHVTIWIIESCSLSGMQCKYLIKKNMIFPRDVFGSQTSATQCLLRCTQKDERWDVYCVITWTWRFTSLASALAAVASLSFLLMFVDVACLITFCTRTLACGVRAGVVRNSQMYN